MSQNTLTPQKIFLTVAILFLIGYGVFNSRFILKGPEIAIAGLNKDGDIIETQTKDFSLQGTAIHSSYITINNRPIFVDESGNFNEKLLLSNGVSIIDIYARDKFGKEIRKKIDVVYTGTDSINSSTSEQIALRTLKTSTSTSEVVESPELSPTETTDVSMSQSTSTEETEQIQQ
jgi:hypothetical protein